MFVLNYILCCLSLFVIFLCSCSFATQTLASITIDVKVRLTCGSSSHGIGHARAPAAHIVTCAAIVLRVVELKRKEAFTARHCNLLLIILIFTAGAIEEASRQIGAVARVCRGIQNSSVLASHALAIAKVSKRAVEVSEPDRVHKAYVFLIVCRTIDQVCATLARMRFSQLVRRLPGVTGAHHVVVADPELLKTIRISASGLGTAYLCHAIEHKLRIMVVLLVIIHVAETLAIAKVVPLGLEHEAKLLGPRVMRAARGDGNVLTGRVVVLGNDAHVRVIV